MVSQSHRHTLAFLACLDARQPLRTSMKKLRRVLIQLNLFRSARAATPADQTRQRWSTRLYLLFLGIALLFLTLYTTLSIESKIVKVKNPTLKTVEHLQSYASSLQCPCTELSISYSDMIVLEAKYHQVCFSEFVTPKWIEGLNDIAALSMESLYYADFRYASPIFQLLKSMCDLANDTITNALFVFGQTQLVSGNLLPPDLFREQLESAIAQFKATTPNALLHLLQLTRNLTYMNQFLSGSYANFFVTYSTVQQYAQPGTILGIYGSSSTLPNGTVKTCSCADDIECGRSAALYTGPSGRRRVIFTVPGFYSRCFPVESLLPSTLECFYNNQPCLATMANITNQTFFNTLTRLNATQASRFPINTTINDLLVELFVESWSSTLFYASYFEQCRPNYCSHVVLTEKSTLEIVTTVTGLIGGLSVALRLIAPHIILIGVKMIGKRRARQGNNVVPIRECRRVVLAKRTLI
jgi:hypothetical protein